ncbi:MAG: hypothetical protein IAI50_03715, partial [Candidatus Eremiobacteraeota bacterium]|nr:hypothetical protein [Candidatus Eremiobacteraeota bacterium]
ATATPSPSGKLLKFSGQILDDRSGFVFFTTGDGFRLDPGVKVDDASTGGVTKLEPVTRVYARAAFDTGTGRVVELALSRTRLPEEASYYDIKKFAVTLSTPYANPDLKGGEGYSGKAVLVIFTVEVPPKTPFSDQVYVATDTSGWSATAIRMDRVDALHYRVSRDFGSGTRFLYRYTRGSWQSAERGDDGLEVKPRVFQVRNSDVQSKNDVVNAWGDSDEFAPDLNGTLPTPFNPVPIITPPRR